MSHDYLFYVPEIDGEPAGFAMEGPEHHHLSKVLRMDCGEIVYATDGRGRIFECRIAGVEQKFTDLAVISIDKSDRSRPETVLALGCINKASFEKALSQCTELGITRCIPFESSNSKTANYNPAFYDRLGRVAAAAMKQSFRSILPDVEEAVGFDTLVERLSRYDSVVIGVQDAAPLPNSLPPGSVMVVIGPEAGFTSREKEALKDAGCILATISPYRLRAETAAVVLTAAVSDPGRRPLQSH